MSSCLCSHIRNADGALLVYDVNSEISFLALEFWVDCIRKCSSEDLVLYLMGNKSDLVQEHIDMRKVNKETAISFVKENKIEFWTECSAKLNVNIRDTFRNFYKSMLFNLGIYAAQKQKLDVKSKDSKRLLDGKSTYGTKLNCCK